MDIYLSVNEPIHMLHNFHVLLIAYYSLINLNIYSPIKWHIGFPTYTYILQSKAHFFLTKDSTTTI